MTENEIAKVVVGTAMRVHTALGPGLLESVYEIVLARALERAGLRIERQKPISIVFEDLVFQEAFRADLWVEDKVIVELKSVESLLPVHCKQVLTQLRLSGLKLGLLLNFGEARLKNGLYRIINGKLTESPEIDPAEIIL
ncbi:MAG: GxxExxY protein [Verrucomicrobia bacterium]|nr:GxxExxY protein [Verrucomicrobiota bacterium]